MRYSQEPTAAIRATPATVCFPDKHAGCRILQQAPQRTAWSCAMRVVSSGNTVFGERDALMISISTLSMQVTYQCNIACRHCGPFCGPEEKDWMTVAEIRDLIRQGAGLDAKVVVFTGGEPTLLKGELPGLFRFIHAEMNIPYSRIVTNARFASTYDRAKRVLAEWQEAGLKELNFSCGEYHQEFVPLQSVINAYRAGCDLGFRTVLLTAEFLPEGKGSFSRKTFEDALGESLLDVRLASPYSRRTRGIECGAVMRFGRGRHEVPEDSIPLVAEERIRSVCDDVNQVITVHPNGNTTACCGVMVREDSLLTIGNWRRSSLHEIVERAQDDLILNWIRYRGLRDMKQWLERKDPTLNLRAQYQNICDLCAEIMYDERCTALLLEHGQEKAAEILAAKVATDAVDRSPEFVYRRLNVVDDNGRPQAGPSRGQTLEAHRAP